MKKLSSGFQPDFTQTGLCSQRKWLEAQHFGFKNKRECRIQEEKTKAMISCAVTAHLRLGFLIGNNPVFS